MKSKLMDYARNQLPGGVYWSPEPAVEKVLKGLRANNDVCESILGLNNHLTTAIPNMHQQTRSNLVEVKKNGTMAWYESLSSEERDAITKLAVKRRKQVMQETKKADEKLSQKRQEIMKQSHQRRQALKAKAQEEQEVLSQEHLIETVSFAKSWMRLILNPSLQEKAKAESFKNSSEYKEQGSQTKHQYPLL